MFSKALKVNWWDSVSFDWNGTGKDWRDFIWTPDTWASDCYYLTTGVAPQKCGVMVNNTITYILPALKRDKLTVEAEENRIIVEHKDKENKHCPVFVEVWDLKPFDGVDAEYRDGVLTLTIQYKKPARTTITVK